jgi:O-antigen ligase
MQVRSEYWKATVGMIADHPMGVGLSNFADVYPRYKTPAGMETREPHNVYLGLLAEAGPLALIALGALLYGCVRLGRVAQTPSAAPSDDTAIRVRVLALAGGLS